MRNRPLNNDKETQRKRNMLTKQFINANAPHQTIILLKMEMMEQMPTGEMTGKPIESDSRLFTVTGKNLEECQNKTNQLLEAIINVCQDIQNQK